MRSNQADQSICIGADTTVVLGKHLLGKPESIEEARWMLRELSGQTHEVLTGIALVTTPESTRTLACGNDQSHFRRAF